MSRPNDQLILKARQRGLARGGNEAQIAMLLLLDGDIPSPPAPHRRRSKLRVNGAELFLSAPRALAFTVLHFAAVKKPRRTHTFALSETARLGACIAPATVGPTAQRVGGHVWGTKAKPLAAYRRRLCCLYRSRGVDRPLDVRLNARASSSFSTSSKARGAPTREPLSFAQTINLRVYQF